MINEIFRVRRFLFCLPCPTCREQAKALKSPPAIKFEKVSAAGPIRAVFQGFFSPLFQEKVQNADDMTAAVSHTCAPL